MNITYTDLDESIDLPPIGPTTCSNGFNGTTVQNLMNKLFIRLKYINVGILPSTPAKFGNPNYILNKDPTINQGSLVLNINYWFNFMTEIDFWLGALYAQNTICGFDYHAIFPIINAGAQGAAWLDTFIYPSGTVPSGAPEIPCFVGADYPGWTPQLHTCASLLAGSVVMDGFLDKLYSVVFKSGGGDGDYFTNSAVLPINTTIPNLKITGTSEFSPPPFTMAQIAGCITSLHTTNSYGNIRNWDLSGFTAFCGDFTEDFVPIGSGPIGVAGGSGLEGGGHALYAQAINQKGNLTVDLSRFTPVDLAGTTMTTYLYTTVSNKITGSDNQYGQTPPTLGAPEFYNTWAAGFPQIPTLVTSNLVSGSDVDAIVPVATDENGTVRGWQLDIDAITTGRPGIAMVFRSPFAP